MATTKGVSAGFVYLKDQCFKIPVGLLLNAKHAYTFSNASNILSAFPYPACARALGIGND